MPIAGVLLSGILADTLLFRGPTTTEEDRRVAQRLATYARVDPDELGECILAIASDVADRTAGELLMADFKEFAVGECRFGIGVLETTNAASALGRQEELLQAMHAAGSYTTVLFAIIDIVHQRTVILAADHVRAVAEGLRAEATGEHTIEMSGIVSRKKMIVPRLDAVCAAIEAAR
jgi:manganese-dependent inorganic pyrophosphatase